MAPAATAETERSKQQGTDEGPVDLAAAGDSIDINTFDQVLEMDEDEEDREFSRSIVYDFFSQAESTFEKMDTGLTERNLGELSSLGHFLKGSSATLGLNKLRDSCERIQHFGQRLDATGNEREPDEAVCLEGIRTTLKAARNEFREVEHLLRRFYGETDA